MKNLEVALELAAAGIAVFPVAISQDQQDNLQKKPACKWKDEASTSEERIRDWWQARPSFVPGINLSRSGLFLIDLDRHPGGPDGVAAFRSLRGGRLFPAGPVTITATGGLHCFFSNPARLTNSSGNLPAGIDVRGVGGFVVAPGSRWEGFAWRSHPKRPRLVDIYPGLPTLPDWLLQVIRPPEQPKIKSGFSFRGTASGLRALCTRVLNSCQGERNKVLFWASCRACDEGGGDFAQSMLLEAAQRAGLPKPEAERTIRSGFKR
jgi:Bifunctional DNA primase/polymerase, N-terminal